MQFRCGVVERIAALHRSALAMQQNPSEASRNAILRLKSGVEEADALLGVFMRQSPGYFKKFMR